MAQYYMGLLCVVAGAMPAVPPVILRVRHALDLPDDAWYVTSYNEYAN